MLTKLYWVNKPNLNYSSCLSLSEHLCRSMCVCSSKSSSFYFLLSTKLCCPSLFCGHISEGSPLSFYSQQKRI